MTEIEQDIISQLVEKLLDIEIVISLETGPLVLFALIERDDAPGKWDLVVSATLSRERHKDLLNRIALQVRNNLKWEEKVILSRILILDPEEPFVRAINNMANVEHGRLRVSNSLVNEISVKDAYIFTSNPQNAAIR